MKTARQWRLALGLFWLAVAVSPQEGGAAEAAAEPDLKPGDHVRFISQDIRVVNRVPVDVQPVRAWLLNRQGDRPLKHWKQIQVFEIKERYAGAWDRCIVKTENGDFVELFIAHLPPEVAAYFTKRKKLEADLAALRAVVETEEKRVREADAVTPGGIVWPPGYVPEEVLERRAVVNLAAEKLRQKKVELAKLEEQFTALRNSGPMMTTELAMFTGRRHAGLEIWDCGIKRQ